MSFSIALDPPSSDIRVLTLAQLSQGSAWRLELPHDRPDHLLLWITRGQGLGLIDGARRGLGMHNALFVPARTLVALSLGRQSFGHAVLLPAAHASLLPESVAHERIRDASAQIELTALIEAMGREQDAERPLHQDAMAAYADLMAIWLHRQVAAVPDTPARPTAALRLTRAFCARLVSGYANGDGVAEHAAALNVTPTHLTRVCNSEIGKTAATLLAERQLHGAYRLLSETDLPVREVAQQLGFGSAAYFTRFVQQHTGQPPTALRRSAQSRA